MSDNVTTAGACCGAAQAAQQAGACWGSMAKTESRRDRSQLLRRHQQHRTRRTGGGSRVERPAGGGCWG